MTAASSSIGDRTWSRARDRRAGLSALLASVVGTLHDTHGAGLRMQLLDALRRLVPARRVEIRDAIGPGPKVCAMAGSFALEIPGGGPARRALLEVAFDPVAGLDEWDLQVLDNAACLAALVLELERARTGSAAGARRSWRAPAPVLVGSSRGMEALRRRIHRVAATDFTILIEGESGSGKELVARQIHEESRRRCGPFVAVNCAALVETLLEAELFGIEERTATGVRGRRGKIEHAEGGTLFLDEVSDLSPSAQAKLLRAIQELAVERVGSTGTHRVDTRVVVASNRSLGELVKRGQFRADLYYRLSGVDIRVPSLRERPDDIPELANYFLERHRSIRNLKLSGAVMDALVSYSWPGNVRELERAIEGSIVQAAGEYLQIEDLPPTVSGRYGDVLAPAAARGETMREWGSRYARLILERSGNNKRRACRALGISYHTLQGYLRSGGAISAVRRGDM